MRDLLMLGVMLAWVPMAFMNSFIAFLLWLYTTLVSPSLYLYGFMQGFRYAFLFAGLTLFLLMARKVKDRGKFVWDATSVLMIIFFCHAMLSAALSLQPNPSVVIRVEDFLKSAPLALVLPFFLTSRWRIHATLLILVLGLGFHGVVDGLKVIASGGGHNIHGIGTASLNDNNLYAVGMVMLLPIYLYLIKYSSNKWVRIALIGGFLLTIMTVLGSNSRGGFLALAVVGFWYWVTSRRKFASMLLVLVLSFGIVQVAPDRWFDRISTIKTATEDTSFMNRVAAWRINLSVATTHPVFGGGFEAALNSWVWNEHKYKPSPINIEMDLYTPKVAHSIYFQVLGDLGFVGLFWYLLLLFNAFWTRYKAQLLAKQLAGEWQWAADLSTATVLSLVAFMIGGAGVSLAYYELVFVLIMLVAVVYRQLQQAIAAKVGAQVSLSRRPEAGVTT
jgi:probable O-glycosylation ligase (exosortase A-associated)